jgi:hypothetical protein
MPTHTHVSHTHSHAYDHFGTATCRGSGMLEIVFTNKLMIFGMVMDSSEITIVKLVIMLG